MHHRGLFSLTCSTLLFAAGCGDDGTATDSNTGGQASTGTPPGETTLAATTETPDPTTAGPGGDSDSQGTGHLNHGGATGWYKATSGVKPGETFKLAFGIWDMGDFTFDTTALIDNWLWDCEGCVPNEVNSCGIEPQ